MAAQAGPGPIAGWISLGGALVEGAAVASWGTFESEVFAVLDDGQVWNRYWDGSSWHDWEPMGGAFAGTPAAAARDADRIDVFAVGRDGILRQRWWDGTKWVPWRAVEGAPEAPRAIACTWVGGELRLFARDRGGALWVRTSR